MNRIFIMFLIISFAHSEILEREDVKNFIKLAVESSELTKEDIESYLVKAVPSKKAQTARQNQPEVKATWNSYRNRYVTSSRINNGVKFVKDNYEILESVEKDFDLVPVISGLDETIEINNNVFRTTDKKAKNIVLVRQTSHNQA